MIRRVLMVSVAVLVLAACGAAEIPSPAPPATPVEPGWQLGWADGTVFYEIFVRSFADSDGDGDRRPARS